MPDVINSRGVSMTVRPLTPHEMRRWRDAEIAFTIHYEGGGIRAHALTMIGDAEEFADTIKQACKDARTKKERMESLRHLMVFMRCK